MKRSTNSDRTRASRKRRGFVASAIALLAPVTIALGQAAVQGRADGAPKAIAESAGFAKASNSVTVLELRAESGALSVRLEGDRVVATLNGKPLSKDRIQISDQYIIVLDAKGQPLATMGRAGLASSLRPALRSRDRANGLRFEFEQIVENEPRRVIGVVTNPLDDKLAAKLNARTKDGLVITAVVPGQPAAKAGMRPYDVVTAVDGRAPATIETLRHVIRSKAPGEPIELSVLRSGEPLKVSLTAIEERAEPRRFERIDENILIPQGDAFFAWQPDDVRLAPEVEREMRAWVREHWDAERSADQLAARIRDMEKRVEIDEQRRREIEANLRSAAQSLRELEIDVDFPEISFVGSEEFDVAVFPRGTARAGAAVFETPRSDVNERLRDVEQRLMRLEALLRRLVEPDAPDTAPPSAASPDDQDKKQPGA